MLFVSSVGNHMHNKVILSRSLSWLSGLCHVGSISCLPLSLHSALLNQSVIALFSLVSPPLEAGLLPSQIICFTIFSEQLSSVLIPDLITRYLVRPCSWTQTPLWFCECVFCFWLGFGFWTLIFGSWIGLFNSCTGPVSDVGPVSMYINSWKQRVNSVSGPWMWPGSLPWIGHI